jgi:ribonucleases P/MRP protein subunit RPP40
MNHMIDNNLLSDKQHGFIQGQDKGAHALLNFSKSWTSGLKSWKLGETWKLSIWTCTKRLTPHERLLIKLEAYGKAGDVLEWISQFLKDRRQRVAVAGSVSEWARVISGVPQGSVFGPLLFICYINDMPDTIDSMIHLYADDSKLCREVENELDARKLQTDINKLQAWSRIWQLVFNAEKCKVMHIGKSNQNRDYFMIEGEGNCMERTDLEKDLGVWADNSLKFNSMTT